MKTAKHIVLISIISIFLFGCARTPCVVKAPSSPSYIVFGKTYHPLPEVRTGFTSEGIASWYGPGYHGRKTSCGEVYDMHAMTAAHTTLHMNALVKVTNLENGRHVVVRVNDRGPFIHERVIDLSLAAANKLDMIRPATVPVKVVVLGKAEPVKGNKPSMAWNTDPLPPGPNPFYIPATHSRVVEKKG
jgi:rare lipoprotein A